MLQWQLLSELTRAKPRKIRRSDRGHIMDKEVGATKQQARVDHNTFRKPTCTWTTSKTGMVTQFTVPLVVQLRRVRSCFAVTFQCGGYHSRNEYCILNSREDTTVTAKTLLILRGGTTVTVTGKYFPKGRGCNCNLFFIFLFFPFFRFSLRAGLRLHSHLHLHLDLHLHLLLLLSLFLFLFFFVFLFFLFLSSLFSSHTETDVTNQMKMTTSSFLTHGCVVTASASSLQLHPWWLAMH